MGGRGGGGEQVGKRWGERGRREQAGEERERRGEEVVGRGGGGEVVERGLDAYLFSGSNRMNCFNHFEMMHAKFPLET